ncbi:hypothetical protein KY289_013552 [Solanum tuberosum]|nr:hypothetical protein KY289_013552 [Solanum tuberosum]
MVVWHACSVHAQCLSETCTSAAHLVSGFNNIRPGAMHLKCTRPVASGVVHWHEVPTWYQPKLAMA